MDAIRRIKIDPVLTVVLLLLGAIALALASFDHNASAQTSSTEEFAGSIATQPPLSDTTENAQPTIAPTDEPSATEEIVGAISAAEVASELELTQEIVAEQTEAAAPLAIPPDVQALADPPDLELFVSCPVPNQAEFTITNTGGDMLSDGSYTITEPGQPTQGPFFFRLLAGESLPPFQTAGNAAVDVQYNNGTEDVTLSATGNCTVQPTNTSTSTPTNTPTSTPTFTFTATRTFTPTNTPTSTTEPTITS